MKFTETELIDMWVELIEIINTTFTGERLKKLSYLYTTLQDRILLAPASHNKNYYGAYPGGYLESVLQVVKIAQYMGKLWEKMGGNINYTSEELIFCALNHMLGKLGDDKNELYIPNDNDWFIKNRGEIYMFNPKVIYMTIPDRSIWLLQHFGLELTQNEYISIKTYEGLLNEANNNYFKGYNSEFKSHLPILIHQANFMAYRLAHEIK